jgi:group II intron reverse transcriptase/maturase
VNAQKANDTIDKARQLQRKLYLAAKGNRKRRFHAMYDKVHRLDILEEAWRRVKANGGAAGIDKMSIEDVKAYGENKMLAEISEMLEENKYRPLPVRRTYIPKSDGSKRPLGIPVIKDRIVQMATKLVIEPVFEADFLDCSFGFRPKRSAQQALNKIYEVADIGDALWVIDADIKDYFGSINHEKLMLLVKQRISDRRILKLIWQWLKAGVMEQGEYRKSDKGAPQGGVISPLLSNIYLHYFDHVWTKQYSHLGTLVRYADDFVILSKRKQQADQAMQAVHQIMGKLELTIHEGKTKQVDMYFGKEGFDFLGFHHRFKRGRTKTWKWYWRLFQVPSHKAMKKMRANIKAEFESPARHLWSLQDMIKLLNPKIIGMRNYYNREFAQEKLWHIDRYIVQKFTKWFNYKRQRQHRLGSMDKIRELIYRSGLARMRVS